MNVTGMASCPRSRERSLSLIPIFDFRTPGKEYVKAYADFIVDKSRKLGSYGTLEQVRAAVS